MSKRMGEEIVEGLNTHTLSLSYCVNDDLGVSLSMMIWVSNDTVKRLIIECSLPLSLSLSPPFPLCESGEEDTRETRASTIRAWKVVRIMRKTRGLLGR